MSTPSWSIPRRTFLRGAGYAIALPLMDAMLPRTLFGGEPKGPPRTSPARFAALYMPNGALPGAWRIAEAGKLGALPPILSPLEAIKEQVLVLSGMANNGTNSADGHYCRESAWLTGTSLTKTTGADVNIGGVSIDQVMAQQIGQQTKLASLELGLEQLRTGVDNNVGITQLYGGHISWSSPTTPVAREIDPRQAFERLFKGQVKGDKDDKDAKKKQAGIGPYDDASILDAVADDTAGVKAKLGGADQRKLDEYLTSLRDVERRIQQEQKRANDPRRIDPAALRALPLMHDRLRDGKLGDRRNHAERVTAMLDLIALAFWTDITRVGTLMFGVSVSGVDFSFLDPALSNHHEFSHHQDDPAKMAGYQRISTWYVEQYAYLLDRLQNIKEGDGTLLDSSMILFGSALADGNAHDPRNLPLVLGGGGKLGIAGGRHVALPNDTPFCNLHLDLAQRMGCKLESFADSTGTVAQLKG